MGAFDIIVCICPHCEKVTYEQIKNFQFHSEYDMRERRIQTYNKYQEEFLVGTQRFFFEHCVPINFYCCNCGNEIAAIFEDNTLVRFAKVKRVVTETITYE